MVDHIERLYAAVVEARGNDPASCRTARLFEAGQAKIGKKVIEEAAEIALAYTARHRKDVVRETADLLYNLTVLLVELDIFPEEIWEEMSNREALYGIAGKVPKSGSRATPSQKTVARYRRSR